MEEGTQVGWRMHATPYGTNILNLFFHILSSLANKWSYIFVPPEERKKFVDFPVEGLSLRAHILSDKPSASYSLCVVSNHFGTLSGVDTIPTTLGLLVGMSGTIAMTEVLAG